VPTNVFPTGRFDSSPTATVSTDSNGIATAPSFRALGSSGSYVVTASVGGSVTPASFNLTNIPPNISTKAGTPQSAVVGRQFSIALQAMITDSNNMPVPQG